MAATKILCKSNFPNDTLGICNKLYMCIYLKIASKHATKFGGTIEHEKYPQLNFEHSLFGYNELRVISSEKM